MFHALTGCDTTSGFNGRGKITCWDAWKSCPSLTDTLLNLSNQPETITEEQFQEVEKFVIVVYQKSCESTTCDEARRFLFTSGRAIDNIPQTCNALLQHLKREILRAGFCWTQLLQPNPNLPNPADWS